MAINIVERKNTDRKLYTGLCDLRIVAINPTAQEIMDLTGRTEVKEPEYGGFTESGIAKLRLDFWMQNETYNILFKDSIWLENRETLSAQGKTQWVNDVGVSNWSKKMEDGSPESALNPKMAWFTKRNPRPAHVGEADLYSILTSWCGENGLDQKAEDSQLVLDTTWDDIIEGDLQEIQDFISLFSKYGVRRLLSVKDSKYQSCYPKVVTPYGSKYIQGYTNSLEADKTSGYAYKADYQNSFALQEYTGEPAPSTPLVKQSVDAILNNL